MNIFEINTSSEINIEYIDNSPVYTIQNFYKYPIEVFNFFSQYQTSLWKADQKPSYNGVHFDDRRQRIETDQIIHVNRYLENICIQSSQKQNYIVNNITKFISKDFNDYKNNYWWPHRDNGYNGIVYFTENENAGTNLYENINDSITTSEHNCPWRDKNKWRVIKTFKSTFNSLVLFDGLKFLHGMNIEDDYYFDTYRVNQVFFFNHK